MVRTQIQLTEEQIERLRSLAAERGQSVAEAVRQCIDSTLRSHPDASEGTKRRRALQVIGAFRSGKGDISTRHDDYLAGDYTTCASS